MSNPLHNSTVIVTGAKGALGSTMREIFSEKGYHVVGIDRSPTEEDSSLQVDLSSFEDVQRSREYFDEQPQVSTLIHCAGGFRFGSVDQLSAEDFEFLMSANLASTFNVLKGYLPLLMKSGRARIILISSQSTQSPAAVGFGAYVASKSAMNCLLEEIHAQYFGQGLTINALMPTIIDTPANRQAMPDADTSAWVKPAQMAEIAYQLTLPAMDRISGTLIAV